VGSEWLEMAGWYQDDLWEFSYFYDVHEYYTYCFIIGNGVGTKEWVYLTCGI
jgi:hypothetical protein